MSGIVGTARQYARFTQVDPRGQSVLVLLGDGYPKWTTKGGWQFTGRTRRTSMTEYIGDDPYQMVIPCILDGYSTNTFVEGPLESLRRMMTNIVGPRREPALVRVTGAAIPLSNVNWVIQTIDITSEIRREDGPRIRAEFDVTLFQYVAPDILVSSSRPPSPAAAAQTRNGSPVQQRTYTVRSGDTLSAIASRLLGNAGRWGEIASLNGIRDPRTLRIGQVLRIPG